MGNSNYENMLKKRLTQLHQSTNLRKKEVARQIGINYQTYSNYINGKFPNYDTLIQIANFYNVSIDYLLGQTDNPNIIKPDSQLDKADILTFISASFNSDSLNLIETGNDGVLSFDVKDPELFLAIQNLIDIFKINNCTNLTISKDIVDLTKKNIIFE